jgi:hypothetical protein
MNLLYFPTRGKQAREKKVKIKKNMNNDNYDYYDDDDDDNNNNNNNNRAMRQTNITKLFRNPRS